MTKKLEDVDYRAWTNEPIAIIGLGCRFPGGIDSPQAFWSLLHEGLDAITEIPADRWNIDAYYDPDPEAPGKIYTRHGGFLEAIDEFDAKFFSISPREARSLDPQHRLLLEVTWEALEHANLIPDQLFGSMTGVFVGISIPDYLSAALNWMTMDELHKRTDAYFGTGNAFSAASGRLSYTLGLVGPNIAVDTACSSSMTALHLACQSLRQRECHLALAGGVNLLLAPGFHIAFCKARMLAADGHCKTFDIAADGYVRGEGCGMVVLKRLSDAITDEDNILAVIRGSAINQDGPSSGLTAPNGHSQEAVIRQALTNACVEPAQISCIEAHGTGTFLGDPIEANVLGKIFGPGRSSDNPLYIGSVKTNIGHLESAAGIAGLIKTILALQHQEIPRHLHFNQLNPHITWDGLPLLVPTEQTPWITNGRRLAGLSGFGFGGSNAHIILEEAPIKDNPFYSESLTDRPVHLLTLSAKTEIALQTLANQYEKYLAANPKISWADMCFTANTCRSQFQHGLAIVAASVAEGQQKLAAFNLGRDELGIIRGQRSHGSQSKIAFLFTGQGSQYVNMGRQLYHTQSTFREILDRCNEILGPYLKRPLLSVLYPDLSVVSEAVESRSEIDMTAYTQPALFALEYALAELWQSWGIKPDIVMGHSIGEYVAACVAGVFSLEEGLKLIAERGRLMQALPQNGRMVAVFADEKQVRAAIAPYSDQVSIASLNGPQNIVISGEQEAVMAAVTTLMTTGIKTEELNVSHAFHSPLMDPILADFERILSDVTFSTPRVKIVSNVTGRLVDDQEMASPTYWCTHIRQPVQFAASMDILLQQGCKLFLEIGPRPILLGLGRQNLPTGSPFNSNLQWLPTLRPGHEDWRQLLQSLGSLYACGVPFNWPEIERDYASNRKRVILPTYPFQRQRYWIDKDMDGDQTDSAENEQQTRRKHPLLGKRLAVAGSQAIHFESQISVNTLPFLKDHRFFREAIMPASAYLEMALAAGMMVFKSENLILEDVRFEQVLTLPESKSRTVQFVLTPLDTKSATFQIFSLAATSNKESEELSWIQHASGQIRVPDQVMPPQRDLPALLQTPIVREDSPEYFYYLCLIQGFMYGPDYQSIVRMQQLSPVEANTYLGQIQLHKKLASEISDFKLHPVLLDGCFQLAAHPYPVKADPVVPISLKRLTYFAPAAAQTWVYYQGSMKDSGQFTNMYLLDENGTVAVELEGFHNKRIKRETLLHFFQNDVLQWLYQIVWRPRTLSGELQLVQPRTGSTWLIFADQTGLGLQLAEQLKHQGEHCLFVWPGSTYARLTAKQDLISNEYCINPTEPGDFQQLLEEVLGEIQSTCRGVVYLWSLDANLTPEADPTTLQKTQDLTCRGVLHLIQALVCIAGAMPPQLWLVTKGTQAVEAISSPLAVAQSSVWGLGRVIAMEHPELNCVRLDLDPMESQASHQVQHLFETLWFPVAEDQIAYRQGIRYVARLIRYGDQDPISSDQLKIPAEPFKLALSKYGVLDNLTLMPITRQLPGPGEVEVQVRAAGLNFRDVLNALGMLKEAAEEFGIETPEDMPFGGECAGTIVAVGEQVSDFQVGDDVIVALTLGSMSSYVTANAKLVIPKPPSISFAEATTLPITFLTAYYGLHELAKIKAGDRVLIHAAAGGVGQAACQLAQQAGAEIFATASPNKWEFLKRQGITHVMNSRTLDFADEILTITNGSGVDIVLNSLNGQFIEKSLEVLKPGGSFVEIGRIGILTQSQMQDLRPDISYFPFDLLEITLNSLDPIIAMLEILKENLEQRTLKPLPYELFPIEEVITAFRHMAQARHYGKVVISLPETNHKLEHTANAQGREIRPLSEEMNNEVRLFAQANKTYLITGGLGDLGMRIATWLVMAFGVRYLVLAGRRGAASPEAREKVRRLESGGVKVLVIQADVSDEADVARLFSIIETTMPPLGGIVHAAGVLDDGILLQQTWERFDQVMAPKVLGTWNLHRLTQNISLDFFICFSSIASLLGSPGQGNYAAANAFMDSLMYYRRSLGLPGWSINWGPWAEVGMAANLSPRYQSRLAMLGFDSLVTVQTVLALEFFWKEDLTQAGVMSIDWSKFFQQLPLARHLPLLEAFAEPTGRSLSRRAELLNQLKAAPSSESRSLLIDYLRSELARILGLPSPEQIDPLYRFMDLGLDSLMAFELRNSLEAALGQSFPATLVFNYPTIVAIADYLVEEVLVLDNNSYSSIETEVMVEQIQQIDSEVVDRVLTEVEALSDEEIIKQLQHKG